MVKVLKRKAGQGRSLWPAFQWQNRWPAGLLVPALLIAGLTVYRFCTKNDIKTQNVSVPILKIRGIERETYFYLQSVTAPPNVTAKENTPGIVIVPHHLLANSLINEAFAQIAHNNYKLVVIISPDHFYQTQEEYSGFGTMAAWETPFGIQQGITAGPFRKRLQKLLRRISFSETEEYYQVEHGVYGLVPYIRHYFPQSRLLALSLGNQNLSQYTELAAKLELCAEKYFSPSEILLVVSTDFVHHGRLAEMAQKAQRNLKLLQHLNLQNAKDIENDFHGGWFFVLGWLKAHRKTPVFEFLNSKDSHDFGGGETEITSYITGYF
jgi:AmmeMemoRadiSam system protein B